jgi:hypothetical protein
MIDHQLFCSHSAFVGFCRGTSEITSAPTLDRGVSFSRVSVSQIPANPSEEEHEPLLCARICARLIAVLLIIGDAARFDSIFRFSLVESFRFETKCDVLKAMTSQSEEFLENGGSPQI